MAQLRDAPTVRPTAEELANPVRFVRSLTALGSEYGIVRVELPEGYLPPTSNPLKRLGERGGPERFPTKLQLVHGLRSGKPFQPSGRHSLSSYAAQAAAFAQRWDAEHPGTCRGPEAVERAFWAAARGDYGRVTVQYGSDLDTGDYGSGFDAPEACASHPWSLPALCTAPGNLLACLGDELIAGVTRPWLYCGMRFAAFGYHVEDHGLLSVNYLHPFSQAPKTWYGAPASAKAGVEAALRNNAKKCERGAKDLLGRMNTVLPPEAVLAEGVPLVRALQRPGDLVITFPDAFHAGFSHGVTFGEAVNLATPEWLEVGRRAVVAYAAVERPPVFAHAEVVVQYARALRRAAQAGVDGSAARLTGGDTRCEWTSRALGLLAGDVEAERRLLKEAAVPVRKRSAPKKRDMRCGVCGEALYASVLVCDRHRTRMSCPRHAHADYCGCGAKTRRLEQFVSVEELRALEASVLPEGMSVTAAPHVVEAPPASPPSPAPSQGQPPAGESSLSSSPPPEEGLLAPRRRPVTADVLRVLKVGGLGKRKSLADVRRMLRRTCGDETCGGRTPELWAA